MSPFYKIWHLKKKSKFIVDRLSQKSHRFLIDVTITDAFKVIITLDR
jgi:uncharacterized Tic20 family protein